MALNPYYNPARQNPYAQQANPYLAEVELPMEETPVPVYNEFEKGIQRGLGGMGPSIDRTQAAVQGALGFDEAAQANLVEARQAEAYNARPEIAARVQKFSDIGKTGNYLSDAGAWAASSVAENLPLMGSMAALAPLGAAAGALRTGAFVANRAGAAVAGLAPYFVQTTGENSQNILDDPNAQGTLQEKSLGALAGGAAQTALGAVPIGGALSRIAKPGLSLGQRAIQAGGVGMVGEGLTEAGEEATKKFVGQQFSPENPANQLTGKRAWQDYVDAAAGGALVGGAFGAGGATISHPFLMSQAAKHPEGWQGFAKEHSAILDDQDRLNMERYSAQPQPTPVPDSAFGRKLQEIQERDALDIAYQDLLGQPRKEFLAQRQQRQATLDRLGKQFFFQGQLDPKDPEATALMQATPEWESILDSYAEDKKDDWLRERLGSSAEQSALNEFEPEERLQLALLRDLAKDPKTRPEFLQLAGESGDLLNRYEGLLGNVSRTARAQQEDEPKGPKTTLDPSAGRSERALGQQAEGDYTAEGFGSDLAFADQRQLNPGYSEQETSNDYRLGLGGTPWKSLDASLRDRPDLPPALYQEGQQRRWEKQVIEELPTEAQEAYKDLYAPESAVDTKWRRVMKAGELTPEQQAERQAEKAAAEAQVQANLAAWREARDTERNPDDEWGQKLNNTDLRPVPLRRMVEEEYGLDPERVPEDRQELERIVIRDFLSREKPEVQQRYGDDPVAYAEDYEVLNKPKMPAVISGRDELTPTRRELVPPGRPRDRAAIAQKETALLDTLDAQREGDYDAYKHFTKDELGVVYKSIGLEGDEAKQFYEANKDVLDRAAKARDSSTVLSTEARVLKEDLRTLKRTGQAVIVDRPNDRRKPGEPVSDFSRKRIPIEQYNAQQKKWVKKSIDPMQLVIQEMSRKKNFSADPDKFVDEVAAAFESGLAGMLYNESLGVRLDTEALPTKERVRVQSSEQGPSVQFPQDIQIDPETIIYSRKDGGLQLRWKDLEVKGNERMKRILGGLQQRYKQAPSAEAREAITATAESVKQDMRLTVDGAGQVALREEQLARKRLANDPAALKTELVRIEQQRKSDLRAIGAERGKERWLSEQDGSAVPEMGDGLETTAGEAQPLPLNQSNRWVDNMAREAGPYAPDKKEALAAREPTRWASKPMGVKKIAAFTDEQGVAHPAREIPNGYEVSPKGDRRFSQFGATLKDGRNIDTAFKQAMPALRKEILQQATKAEAEDVARRQEIARKKGLDPATIKPREIKERSPTPQEAYPVYKALWQQWHAENPGQLEELRKQAAGRPLTDRDMRKGAVSPARALAELLDETAPKGVTESQYAALPGQKPAPKRATPTLSVVEMPTSYAGRTQHNADQAEVTAAFAINNESTGERQTARAAGDKLVQWDGGKLSGFAQAITSKLQERQGTTLNVAGNGMVRWAERGYDQEKVTKAMYSVLRKVKEDHPTLERVVTGGQSGSDIAGAIAARALGLTVEVNMPKGFKQLVPGGRLGKTVNRTQAEVEAYIEREAAKLTTPAQEVLANPPQSPQREFGVYGQSPDTVGPPAMPKPSANLRPEEPSRSAGEVSTADLKRAAGVPNGPPPKRGVFDNDLDADRPTSTLPDPVTPLATTPQRQLTQARDQASPLRADPELTRAEALANPDVPELTRAEAPRPEYQPLLENYQAALAARETARSEVLPNLNRPEKERLRANTRLFQAGQQVKQLRQQFIKEYGQDPEQLTAQEQSQLDETGAVQSQAATALYQTENPPNALTPHSSAASPNVGMARPDPRAVPGQTRLSLKEQPAPDPQIGDRRPAPGYQASGQIPFNTTGVKPDGLRPQEVQQQAPTDAETAPVAATQPVAAPAAAAPIRSTDTAPQNQAETLAPVEVPLHRLQLSQDVPQFKEGANAQGVVEPLEGKFDRTGTAPIQVWERSNGRLEVISGRHRLDLARRSNEGTISAQIHREVDGFDKLQAAALDASLNIRDGQGKVTDYVDYFKARSLSYEQAKAEGLVGRNPGKRSYAIANNGGDTLIAQIRAGAVTDTAAEEIANAAPGDDALQAVALQQLGKGRTPAQAVATLHAVKALSQPAQGGQQADLFGFDDSQMRAAERMGAIAARKQREVESDLTAISGVARNPTLAAKYDVNVKDPDSLKAAQARLKAERDAWKNWSTTPELVEQVRAEADVKYQDLGAETPDTPERFQAELDKVTQAEQALPKGQTQREAAMAGQILKALGVTAKVRLAPAAEAFASGVPSSKLRTVRGMAWSAYGNPVIYLSPGLSAEARIEVMGHELGHIIYKDSYQSASAETKAAIEQAFNTWRDQHGRGRVQDVMTSKKGVLTLNDYFGNDTDFNTKSVEALSEQERNYLLDFEEWFADQTSRWLVTDAKPMGLVQQFFHDLANRIRDLLKQLRPNAPDAEVAKFLNAMFDRQAAQPQAKPKAKPKAQAKGSAPSPTAQAAQATAINPFGAQARQSVKDLMQQLTAEERRVLGMAFRAAPVQAQLRKRLANDPVAYDRIRDPDDAIAYGFQFWQAGDLKLGPRANSLFQRTWNRLNTAIGQVTEQDQAEALLQAYQQGRLERRAQGLDNFSIVGQLSDTAVRRGYQKLAQTSRPLLEMLRKVAFTGHTQMTALENPHIDRLAELIYNEVGTEGVGQGMLAAQTQEMGRFTDRLHTIFDGKDQALGEQVLDVLTKRTDAAKADPQVQLMAAKVYQLLQEIYQYTRDAGVALPSKGEVITLAGRKVNNYFPRVLDVDYLQQHSDEFVQMLMQAKYEKWVNGEGGARGILGAYIQNFGSETEFDPDAELGAPQAGAFKKREFDWIEDADMAPFLSRNLGEGMVSYIHQAVKRVEFLRRFGDGKYAQLLERARAEGLQPEQEERVTKYMQGVMGTLGADINPTLNTVQGWILVMENWMILALSTVTSLTDVVGLAVRGDFDTAWQGLKAGMKEVVALAQQDKTELRELAEALGTIEQHTAVEALGFAYGGYQITGMARKLNEALFKYNLMQGWTRGTRLMGLATAKAFVAKHGQRTGNATSQRFLDQLGLREGDVKVKDGELTILSYAERQSASKVDLARDDRVRAALNQFTDEAILRPNAAMRPIWANDPHAMLLFHMKSFTYAFHERILKRVLSEAAEGNYMPMVRFLGYTPAMMAAIALQDAIQGDDDDKPFEEDLWNAAQRSGMPGAFQFLLDVNSDSNYGNVPGTSLLGPTAEHLIDWADAAFTDTSADSVAVRSLPLQNLWKGWLD